MSDLSVFRGGIQGQQGGNWLIANSGNGQLQSTPWGAAYAPYNDLVVSGDYDGDGKTDVAIWRGSEGAWYIWESLGAALRTVTLGVAGDVPVAADYDGDGKVDVAVWQASTGTWTVKSSRDGAETATAFGQSGDTPIMARKN
jgi:spore coat protein A